MWFFKMIRNFFFSLDRIIFNFIPDVYDLLIDIARTSVLTQADIKQMAERIYSFLIIFMVFKVTLSLITYVVNPDEFSDKTKGISKLSTNIIISLTLLILTPYLFRYAYQFQTIILEDNSLGNLIFGDNGNNDFLNSAGEEMAFIAMTPFFTPDTSLRGLYSCINITETDADGNVTFNKECSGLGTDMKPTGSSNTMYDFTTEGGGEGEFALNDLQNYVTGVEMRNLRMMFRKEMVVADDGDGNFIIDYKYIVSTAVGVVILLLLITFCMDVALRSIKLAFLQLIAPIPIISYVDPKSGKDGMFKKWYQMCFKTFLSLFIRILALYFAIYIIDKVADWKLVDVVDGSYKSGFFLAIFIIVGALMFAKQLPKILEGLGVKIDGEGFTLNPFKKFQNEALGGKRITGAAGGLLAGAVGGRGLRLGSAIGGAVRGFSANKGFKGGLDKQADVNRKLREARMNGAGFWGSRFLGLANTFGLDDVGLERESTKLTKDKRAVELKRREVDAKVKEKESQKKQLQDSIAESKRKISRKKKMQEAVSKMEDRAKTEIQNGNGGSIGRTYLTKKAQAEYYENNIGRKIKLGDELTEITPEMAASARQDANTYLNDVGMKQYMTAAASGKFDDGNDDKTFANYYKTYVAEAMNNGLKVFKDGGEIHSQYGQSKGEVGDLERKIAPAEQLISDIDDDIRKIQATTEVDTIMVSDEDGNKRKATIEEAERIIKEKEEKIKDKKEKRKLQSQYSKDGRWFDGS